MGPFRCHGAKDSRSAFACRPGGLAQLSNSSTGYHGYIDTQVRTGSSISIAAKAGQSPHSPIGVLGSFCAKGDTRQAAFSFRRARVAAYCVAIVSQARAATMLESDVVTGIFDAGQGVRRLQSARLSHHNHETKRRTETVKAARKKTVERQRGSAKAPLVNDDISRQADKTDDPYEDNDLGTEWRRDIDPNERMKNRP
jgi:hypothetical protein